MFYVYELKKCVPAIFASFVLGMICLKAHNTHAADTTNRSLIYAKTQALKKAGGNSNTSSYFQRNPFGPNTYAFGYEVNDNRTGNVQFRDERRYVNGSVAGSFGYVRPDGRVIVTHFLSDGERGFLHDTRTFEAGEQQKWQAHWPTKRPNILMQRPQDMPTVAVVYDKNLHLNVTSGQVPAQTANAIKDQHGIDVNASGNSQAEMDHIALQDIINGKVPLQVVPGKTEDHVGFASVHDFLPPGFSIVPFKLPTSVPGTTVSVSEQQKPPKSENSSKNSTEGKYNKAKTNNAEKTLNAEKLPKSANVTVGTPVVLLNVANRKNKSDSGKDQTVGMKPSPLNQAASDGGDGNGAWYQQLIDDTRNEFLSDLPELN